MNSGLLGLQLPLHQQQNPQNPQSTHHLQHQQMVANYDHPQSQQSVKHANYPYASSTKPKPQSPLSDEDEPGFTGDDTTSDGKRKMSPWQRMKWTDSMVRLLIMAVFYIGDEAGSEINDPSGKKKPGGLSQKKGKWKSVSRAMIEKGFFVSPQQCEDKFNDLNKRYKRVNDILGKGTACKVVENQSLLESMDLSPKMKEEAKKLLNSKHLFFREMCAYHNSCGHGSSGVASGATNHSPEVAADRSHPQQPQASHSTENAPLLANSRTERSDGTKMAKRVANDEDDEDEDEDDDSEEDEDDYEEEDDDAIEGHSKGQGAHKRDAHDEDDHEDKPGRKRQRRGGVLSLSTSVMQQLNSELMSVIQDGGKSPWEKKHWMKVRLMQLEEQQVRYECQAFELEKQRLKWVKFSSKKEREMKRAKLENERRKIENERMVLLIRQKEVELLDLQQQQQQFSSNRSDPSSIPG